MSTPDSALHRGRLLMEQGRQQEAVQAFGQALRQQPHCVEPRLALSEVCLRIGDGWAAAAWLSDACRVAPQQAQLWLDLAKLLVVLQRESELAPLLGAATAIHPHHAPLLNMQAELMLRARQFDQALAPYRALRVLQPQDRVTLLHYAFCLEQTGALEHAAAVLREAIAHHPGFMEAHVNLAGLLWRLGEFDATLIHAQKAVELAPTHAHAVRVLGMAWLHLNQLLQAQAHLRQALELQPGFSLAEVDLAFALLSGGQMHEGWQMYGRRWRDEERMHRPSFFKAELEWKGPSLQPLAGKRIVVYSEQGLGDQIQFARYLPLLQQQGATVSVLVHAELVSLVEASMPGVDCLTAARSLEIDHHVALLDLPMHFDTGLDNIPAPVPYLKAPDDKMAQWRDRLAPWSDKPRVGLAWAGSAAHVNNANRSMLLSQLTPLAALDTLQCFSLQKGDAGRWSDVVVDAAKLVDLTEHWRDFSDSAAMLSQLDLIITVDTAIAHLAGALGKPVWVLLPPNPDWRWMQARDDSPWYPTMRLFRRGFKESRAAQVGRVMELLQGQGGSDWQVSRGGLPSACS